MIVAALGSENHKQQAAASTNRGLRETAAPRNDRVQLFQRKSLAQLGTLWTCRRTLPFCSYGISGGTLWVSVAKPLLEKSLSRGLWVKGNPLLWPEHLCRLLLGVLLNPICQHPSRSDECTLPGA